MRADLSYRASRGFTLVELMVTLLVGLTISTTFFSVLYVQNFSYIQRLDEVDAHQNARAAINVMRRYVRQAGWGLAEDPNAPSGASYTVGIGKCFDDANVKLSKATCNNLASDLGADRLRIVYIVRDPEFTGDRPYGAGDHCSTFVTTPDAGSLMAHTDVVQTTPLAVGQLAAIGGACVNKATGYSSAGDAVVITGNSGANYGCPTRYTFSRLDGGTAPGCPGGYAKGFAFGRAVVADFFIKRDATTNNPVLMMRSDPTDASQAGGIPVAFDIEDMQVSYVIDTSANFSRAQTQECDDPRTAGGCNLNDTDGNPLRTEQLYSRIIAVKISLRARTNAGMVNRADPLARDAMYRLFNMGSQSQTKNPVVNLKDGYGRWIYETTISLRNNNP